MSGSGVLIRRARHVARATGPRLWCCAARRGCGSCSSDPIGERTASLPLLLKLFVVVVNDVTLERRTVDCCSAGRRLRGDGGSCCLDGCCRNSTSHSMVVSAGGSAFRFPTTAADLPGRRELGGRTWKAIAGSCVRVQTGGGHAQQLQLLSATRHNYHILSTYYLLLTTYYLLLTMSGTTTTYYSPWLACPT